MATVHRTFINRGKKEVTELKPNYVYAVEYTLDSDKARTLGVRTEQVGLIVTNHYGNITHNYNMQKLNEWKSGGVDLKGKHVWYASEMEIQFAQNYTEYNALCVRFNNARENLCQQMRRVNYYENQPLHSFLESIIQKWNGLFKRNDD